MVFLYCIGAVLVLTATLLCLEAVDLRRSRTRLRSDIRRRQAVTGPLPETQGSDLPEDLFLVPATLAHEIGLGGDQPGRSWPDMSSRPTGALPPGVIARRTVWISTRPARLLEQLDRYQESIARFLLRVLLDPQQARTRTTATFLRAADELWRFRWQRITVGAWLYRLACRELAPPPPPSWRTPKLGPVSLPREPPGPRFGHQATLASKRSQRSIFRCLAQLDPRCRDTLILHYWEGLSLTQIAAILGISEKKTAELVLDSRRQLRRLLASEKPEPPDLVA